MTLEDELKEINLGQQSELQGVAKELWDVKIDNQGKSSIDMKSNIEDEELGLIMVNNIIWDIVGLKELNPADDFTRLTNSRKGWKTEQFVRTAQGTQDVRQGSGMMGRMKGLFNPRE